MLWTWSCNLWSFSFPLLSISILLTALESFTTGSGKGDGGEKDKTRIGNLWPVDQPQEEAHILVVVDPGSRVQCLLSTSNLIPSWKWIGGYPEAYGFFLTVIPPQAKNSRC